MGSCEGGTKARIRAKVTDRKPVPATIHMPVVPPGMRNCRGRSGWVCRSRMAAANMSMYMMM